MQYLNKQQKSLNKSLSLEFVLDYIVTASLRES